MDISAVFNRQRGFFLSGDTKELSRRQEALRRLKRVLKANESHLYDAVYNDFRKNAHDTYITELGQLYREIDFLIRRLPRLATPRRVKTPLYLQPAKSYIYPEPLGVTLVIGAWNYPYVLSLLPAASTIAGGNTCIVKPSELSENAANVMAELINAHFPPELLHVVTGGIPETTELLKHRFDKIFFTGSPRVGRIVYEAAAKNLVPVVLELGGKSPAIVTRSADLRIAAKRIVWGKFLNSGQTCIAPDYVLVEKSVKAPFISLLKDYLQRFDYTDGAEHYTSIVNHRNFNRLLSLIDPRKVIYGGTHNQETRWIAPTLLDNVGWEDPVMQEEIFGPILPIIAFESYEGVLRHVAAGEKPLAAYLFSRDRDEKAFFLNTLPFGGGCVNAVMMHYTNDHLPFGGIGNSGIGSYHGAFSFAAFTHQKAVLKKATWGEPDLMYPPYTKKKKRWLRRLL